MARIVFLTRSTCPRRLATPLVVFLSQRLDMVFDNLQRGFVLNEVRLTAKRASNKAIKVSNAAL